jgi:hypothetical protein
MADLLETATDWLEGKRKAHLARSVTYQRGAASVEVQATVGRKTYDVAAEYGALVQVDATDFIIAAADLVLGGEQVVPQPGDRVRLTDGAKTEVYEVMGPGPDQACYEPADPYRRAWRVHTKHTATET